MTTRNEHALIEGIHDLFQDINRLRRHLGAEQGIEGSGPHPAWTPTGGLLRTWQRTYPDGSVGRVRGLAVGKAHFWRGRLGMMGTLPDIDERATVYSEGPADSKYEAMEACDRGRERKHKQKPQVEGPTPPDCDDVDWSWYGLDGRR